MYTISKSRSRKRPIIIITGIFFVLLGVSVFFIRQTYFNNLKPYSNSQNSQLITIEKGASVKEIAAILKQKSVIKSDWAFEWYVRNSGVRDQLQAGTYSLKPSLSIPQIVSIISRGNIAKDLITILPAKRIDEIRDGLINAGFTSGEVDQALSAELYANHPALVDKPTGANLEGYLYPESFERTAETKPSEIVKLSLDQMQKYLTPDIRTAIVRQGLTVHEGIILASIVENEVSKPEDRPKVAQVFIKRYKSGIKLQSDATAGYGAVLDGKEPSLRYESAYNTYQHKGLPPTPISNVSKTSIEAVAFPASTDFLYFVSGDDGTTHFSHTLEQHEELTKKYCTKLCN